MQRYPFFAAYWVASLVGGIALLLTLIGVYGVLSYVVAQRTREFGVRIALGATSAAVVADVLRRALATTGIGVAAGLAISAVAIRAMAKQFDAAPAFDPATFAAAIALLVACSAVAALYPALRAARVEPAEVLRCE